MFESAFPEKSSSDICRAAEDCFQTEVLSFLIKRYVEGALAIIEGQSFLLDYLKQGTSPKSGY